MGGKSMRNRKPVLLLSCALPLFAACGSSSSVSSNADAAGPPIVYPGPVVENVPGLEIPFVAGTTFPLADVGYERQEYFLSGDGNSYVTAEPLHRSGHWPVTTADSAYCKTTMQSYPP